MSADGRKIAYLARLAREPNLCAVMTSDTIGAPPKVAATGSRVQIA